MANEGSTKPTYSNEELMANCQRERRLLVDECERLEAENLRVRGLLQRLSKAWEIDPQGETFISLLQELTEDEPVVQELCGDVRSGHTCDLPKGHTELHAENHGQMDELVWNHRSSNFRQSPSPMNRGAESAHSGKQNNADKSELLPTQLPKEESPK